MQLASQAVRSEPLRKDMRLLDWCGKMVNAVAPHLGEGMSNDDWYLHRPESKGSLTDAELCLRVTMD
jgi:hypothetical protein